MLFKIVTVRPAEFDSTELCNWAIALAALAYCANVVAGSHAGDPLAPAAFAGSIFSAGAFNVAAWLMIAARCLVPVQRFRGSAGLAVFTVLSALMCVVPIGLVLAPALVLLGSAIAWHRTLPAERREAGLLLLALGISWGWPFLRSLHIVVGRLDAVTVGLLLRLLGLTIWVQGNIIAHGAFSIEILPACASSGPLADIALAYLVVAFFCRHRLSRADIPWLAASLLYSIMLTEIRLCLMAPAWSDWNWWHNGPGVTIYELAALAGAALFPWLAARRAPARGGKAG